jgi:GT2 family glycosyltransferase
VDCIADIERHTTYAHRNVASVVAVAGIPVAVNNAVRTMTGDHIVLLDASTRVITDAWLETMLELSQRAGIGAVGIRLRYPDGTVAHEGMVCGRLGLANSVDQHLHVIKEMSAVSGACLMTKRAVFKEAAGLDERFSTRLWDVDYCMRIRALGHRVLCTPLAEMTWGEAARTGDAAAIEKDARTFAEQWGTVDEIEDPYLNVNVLWPAPLSLRLG